VAQLCCTVCVVCSSVLVCATALRSGAVFSVDDLLSRRTSECLLALQLMPAPENPGAFASGVPQLVTKFPGEPPPSG